MVVATSSARIEVGIRELKNNLSRYLDRVRSGDQVIVTDRGRPIARLTSIDAASTKLAELVDSGLVQPPTEPERRRSAHRVKASGPVSDLVAEQRR